MRLAALRRAVAVAAQDVILFDTAAADNIAYARLWDLQQRGARGISLAEAAA